jgi:hypothetical protein
MDQKIKEMAESFFEWPTENKSFVTLTSAILFAEKIAEITRKEERERCALLCERVGTETGECPEAYQRDRYRAAMEKVIEFNLQHAEDMCGDATKAESWACVRTLREALGTA